ncbi:hypothetical protein M438DRAFT_156249 [Aureobasidium pullulans EXF-150]|uniref:Uncharacterized protein n=1 Tax=Aureobasidium pullulans EXF-150 TaxID=1043002 RepID=A0A074X560_AURPU|nr:uncharacterized protein M438DRAFT_156249 [Aureobasidium pullulans EXF-150]KEQ78924.1 hypothetical protein M438DRAFT_156249 [Aureobasidium pullulans EXF-150]
MHCDSLFVRTCPSPGSYSHKTLSILMATFCWTLCESIVKSSHYCSNCCLTTPVHSCHLLCSYLTMGSRFLVPLFIYLGCCFGRTLLCTIQDSS